MRGFVLVCLSVLAACAQASDKLKVDVYYESLCPDSLRFITKQLYPNCQYLGDKIQVTLVPFGKSNSVNGGEKFECQHGPQECKGNVIQSCALAELKKQSDRVKFVNCFMIEYNSNSEDVDKCLKEVNLDPKEVDKCVKSDKGKDLQLQAEKDTNAVSPKFIPTIVYNGKFDQKLQDGSIADFKATVCSQTSCD